MSDFKLLAMAVKAAGLHVKGHRVDADDNFTNFIVGAKGTREKTDWNPLTDDGDALRLAAYLELEVSLGRNGCIIYMKGGRKIEEISGDYMSAIRRAIVRAAAAIGGMLP